MTAQLRLLSFAPALLATITVYSTVLLNADLIAPSLAVPSAAIATLAIVAGTWRFAHVLARYGARFAARLDLGSAPGWLAAMLILGVALRLLWVAAAGIAMKSDGITYYFMARQLFEHGFYADSLGDRAYWPPGLPLVYYGLFGMLGVSAWIPVVANLLLFAVTLCSVYAAGVGLFGERAARLATLLATLWPNFIFSAASPSKEMLLTALLSLIVWLLVASWGKFSSGAVLALSACAGIVLGLASLAQPSMLLFPAIVGLAMLAQGFSTRSFVIRFLVLIAAMIVAVAPWSMRNYGVFRQFVPISTNGGDVFYRANNPLTTGGYTARGERDLRDLQIGEVERSRVGYEWGKDWVRENPGAFLALAAKKAVLFLGDDAIGAYESLKRGEDRNSTAYVAAKAFSNGFWLLIWAAILAGWRVHKGLLGQPRAAILSLAMIYLLAIDCVFESGGRHHVPLVGVLAILASVIAVPADPRLLPAKRLQMVAG